MDSAPIGRPGIAESANARKREMIGLAFRSVAAASTASLLRVRVDTCVRFQGRGCQCLYEGRFAVRGCTREPSVTRRASTTLIDAISPTRAYCRCVRILVDARFASCLATARPQRRARAQFGYIPFDHEGTRVRGRGLATGGRGPIPHLGVELHPTWYPAADSGDDERVSGVRHAQVADQHLLQR